MNLELFYVVRVYTENYQKLNSPVYHTGPHRSYSEAADKKASEWLHNNCFEIVKQVIQVEEL